MSEAALLRIQFTVKAATKDDVLSTTSQMITWIDEESKKEHTGPFAWKKASKSTIRRNPCRARRPMGRYEERNPTKPLYRAVAHASLRLFSCNAACLHCVHWLFDCIGKLAACSRLYEAISNFFLATAER